MIFLMHVQGEKELFWGEEEGCILNSDKKKDS